MHKSSDSLQTHLVLLAASTRKTVCSPFLASFCVALLLAWTFLAPASLAAQDVSAQPPPPTSQKSFDLSDEVVRDVLSSFQRAIETRNLDRLLATFDPEATPNYNDVRDQFAAFFRLHDNIKFRYQLLQVTADKDVAFATVDVEMDAQPRDDLPTEQRHSAQLRFQMKLTPKGWRLIGLKPMDFFTQ